MRFSLPAITYGTVTTLIITAILVFLRDVELVHWLTILVGGALIGCVLAFISAWMIRSPTYSIDPVFPEKPTFATMWSWSKSLNRRNDRIGIPPTIASIIMILIAVILGKGAIYGMPIYVGILANGFDIVVAIFSLFSLFYIAGFLFIMPSLFFTEAELRLKDDLRSSVVHYISASGVALTIVWVGYRVITTSDLTPQEITSGILFCGAFPLTRVIVGFALLYVEETRFNTLRDFFIPLMIVLIPLTAYLSGARVG
ncbi:MAG: hypothetical protein RLP44_18775 [Aggregatilineales bacterium]